MPVLWPPLAIHQKEITGSVINQGNKAHTAIRPRCPHDIMCRISSPFKPRHLSERSFGRMAAEEVSRVGSEAKVTPPRSRPSHAHTAKVTLGPLR